jgi:hypothetical protein
VIREPAWDEYGFYGDIDDLYPEDMDKTDDDKEEDDENQD